MILPPQFHLWMWVGLNWIGWDPIREEVYAEYLGAAMLIGALVAIVGLPIVMRIQRAANLGQQVYEDGPKAHAAKQGTPTMGGIVFLVAALTGLTFARAAWLNEIQSFVLAAAVVAAGLVGFLDDYITLKKRRSLGLRARWKMLLLLVIGLFVVYFAIETSSMGVLHIQTATAQWWFERSVHLSPTAFWILAVLAVVGCSNAVNLTDGVDGLAAATVLPPLITLTIMSGEGIGAGVAGALAVFLVLNRFPARIFMGDTGSLALGVLLAALAIETHLLLFLPLLGIVFVVEALSVIIQVVSFKLTGRRVFKMTPLHHHFELSGWSERVVTRVFAAASILASAIFFVIVYRSP